MAGAAADLRRHSQVDDKTFHFSDRAGAFACDLTVDEDPADYSRSHGTEPAEDRLDVPGILEQSMDRGASIRMRSGRNVARIEGEMSTTQ